MKALFILFPFAAVWAFNEIDKHLERKKQKKEQSDYDLERDYFDGNGY